MLGAPLASIRTRRHVPASIAACIHPGRPVSHFPVSFMQLSIFLDNFLSSPALLASSFGFPDDLREFELIGVCAHPLFGLQTASLLFHF